MPMPAIDLSTGKSRTTTAFPKSSVDSAYITERMRRLLVHERQDWPSRFCICPGGTRVLAWPRMLQTKSTSGGAGAAGCGTGGEGASRRFTAEARRRRSRALGIAVEAPAALRRGIADRPQGHLRVLTARRYPQHQSHELRQPAQAVLHPP